MNQKRMVHSSIWASGQVAKLSREGRLLYVGLITLGDDDGRFKGAPALLRSQVYPYDDDVKVADVAKWLKEIEDQKLIVGYEVDGQPYFFHPKWETYQHIREDRRKDSNIPAPNFEFPPLTTSGQPNDNQAATKAPHSIVKVSKVKVSKDTPGQESAFQVFWEKYPNKKAKKAAWKAWVKLDYTPELGQRIMAGLTAAVASEQWTKDGGRYVPHPATWINGERWEDDYKPAKARNTKYDSVGTTASA